MFLRCNVFFTVLYVEPLRMIRISHSIFHSSNYYFIYYVILLYILPSSHFDDFDSLPFVPPTLLSFPKHSYLNNCNTTTIILPPLLTETDSFVSGKSQRYAIQNNLWSDYLPTQSMHSYHRSGSLLACVKVAKMFVFAFDIDRCSVSPLLLLGHRSHDIRSYYSRYLSMVRWCVSIQVTPFLGQFNSESGLPASIAAASYALAACKHILLSTYQFK